MHMCYFSRPVTIAKWHCSAHKTSILKGLTKWSCLTIKVELVIRVPASTSEWPHTKNCGERSYYKRNWQETVPSVQQLAIQLKKGHIWQICLRMAWWAPSASISSMSHHYGNTLTLKLTPSHNFKRIQEIILSKPPIFYFAKKVFLCVLPNNTLTNISSYTIVYFSIIIFMSTIVICICILPTVILALLSCRLWILFRPDHTDQTGLNI